MHRQVERWFVASGWVLAAGIACADGSSTLLSPQPPLDCEGWSMTARRTITGVRLAWPDLGAERYDVVWSTRPDCEPVTLEGCDDGDERRSVVSPIDLEGLSGDLPYHFFVSAYGPVNSRCTASASLAATSISTSTDAANWVSLYKGQVVGTVAQLASAEDGTLYIAGDFYAVGRWTGAAMPVDVESGERRASFPEVLGEVHVATGDGSGGVYLGGRIEEVDGQPTGPLIHIHADGTVDPWAPPVALRGFPAEVHSIVVRDDAVFVLGDFTGPRPVTRTLVAFTRDGQRLAWNPQIDGSVNALAEEDGVLYLLGSFSAVDGQPRAGFAAFDEDRTLTDLQVTLTQDEMVLAYAAGRLYTFDPTSRDVALIRARNAQTGAVEWSTAFTRSPQTDTQPWIHAIRIGAVSGSIYALGRFERVDGTPQSNIAALGPDGRLRPAQFSLVAEYFDAQGRPITSPGRIETVVEHGDTLYVGGYFVRAENTDRYNVAAYALDGTLLAWNPSVDGVVHALVPFDETVYVAGGFESVTAGRRHRLAALRPDGTLSDWQPIVGGVIHALTWQDGRLFVGGNFSSMNGVPRSNVAAFDADGQLLDWAPQVECYCQSGRRGVVFPAVTRIEVVDDIVYLAGAFDAIDGQRRNALGAVGLDGSLGPLSIQLDGRFKPTIYDFAIDDPVIYLGGSFEGVNGEPRAHLAAVNLAGDLESWRSNSAGPVRAVLVHNETVYAGGSSGLVEIDHQGQARPGCSDLTAVYAMVQRDGQIVAGGVHPRGYSLSVCDPQSNEPPVDAGPEFWAPWTPTIRTIVTTADGLTVGGDFLRVDGRPQGALAVIPIDSAP